MLLKVDIVPAVVLGILANTFRRHRGQERQSSEGLGGEEVGRRIFQVPTPSLQHHPKTFCAGNMILHHRFMKARSLQEAGRRYRAKTAMGTLWRA